MRKFGWLAVGGIACSLACSTSSAVFAQSLEVANAATPRTVSTASNADRVIELLKLEETLDSLFEPLIPLYSGNVIAALERDSTMPEVIRSKLGNVDSRQRVAAIIGEEFLIGVRKRYPDMKAELIAEYRAQFSEAELAELADFLASGTGAKWLAASPALQARMGKIGEQIGSEEGIKSFPRALKRIEEEGAGQ